MKLKSAYLAITNFLAVAGKTRSMDNSAEVVSYPHQQDLHIEPYSSRSLQGKKKEKERKNGNCAIWGYMNCKVKGSGQDCTSISIPGDERCRPLNIEMNYTVCNNETLPENEIILLPSLTYYDLYKQGKIRPNLPVVKAGECVHIIQEGTIECFRNRVNAQMMFEGWKAYRRNYGSYCHYFQHYFPKLNKVTRSPTSPPTLAPQIAQIAPPAYGVVAECFLEEIKGSGIYSVPCEELGLEYFKKSTPKARAIPPAIDFARTVQYQVIIQSNVEETVNVTEVSVYLDGVQVPIITEDDNNQVFPGETKMVADFSQAVNFAAYSGKKYDLNVTVEALGVETGKGFYENKYYSTDVPNIFRWRVLPTVGCTVEKTGETCAEYVASLPLSERTTDNCKVDVSYDYQIENIGSSCVDITSVITSVNDQLETNVPVTDAEFCPDGIKTLSDKKELEDLCAMAGKENSFKLGINDSGGVPGEAFLPLFSFAPTMAPTIGGEPLLELTDLECLIKGTSPPISCADYIVNQRVDDLPCDVDVIYRSTISNVGDACIDIESVTKTIDGDNYSININNPDNPWSNDDKLLCENESMTLSQEVPGEDLCELAGGEIDFKVVVVGEDKTVLDDIGSLTFPVPRGEPLLKVTNAECLIKGTSPPMSCADYIVNQRVDNLPCEVDVIYRSTIRNVGDACIDIEKVTKTIDGDDYNININNPNNPWGANKKLFCEEEEITLNKAVPGEDLCELAGGEIDFQVAIIGKDGTVIKDTSFISFPVPNALTNSPTNAPVTPPDCKSIFDSLTFQITRHRCGHSLHSQTITSGARRLTGRGKRGKGKGSVKSCACETKCIDHNCDIEIMLPDPYVIIYAKDTYGSKTELHRGHIPFDTDFTLRLDPFPDCIEVEIRENNADYRNVVQIDEFDTTCTTRTPLLLGDRFGAVYIVGFNE